MNDFLLKPFALPEAWKTGAPRISPLEKALGGTLSEDVCVLRPVPPYDAALRDGWAVRCADHERTPAGDVETGCAPGDLKPGTALWINTGGRIPRGADAVIAARSPDETGRWRSPAKPEEHILREGSEWRTGDVILPAGTRLGAAELALLLEAGIRSVQVRPVPSVGILSTGNELETESGGSPFLPGSFRARRKASDALFARSLLSALGVPVQSVRLLPDEPGAIQKTLLQTASECDFVLTIGGTGRGKKDLMRAVLTRLGARILEAPACSNDTPPFIAGELRGTPVIGLPGNPLGLVMILERSVLPVLLARMGRPFAPGRETALFEGSVPEGLRGDLCVHLHRDEKNLLHAVPIAKGTGRSKLFREANGAVPLDGRSLRPGERVTAEHFL